MSIGGFSALRYSGKLTIMLSKDRRLTKKRDFSKLGTQGRSIHGPFATLRVRMSKAGEKRVAFITSTKVMKRAVDRNRAKRRMREVARKLWDELPDAHLLFILKSECKDVPYQGEAGPRGLGRRDRHRTRALSRENRGVGSCLPGGGHGGRSRRGDPPGPG